MADPRTYTSEDFEEVLATVTACTDIGHGAYVEMVDDAGPTDSARRISAALRMAAAVMRPGWMEEQCPYFCATEEVCETIAAIRKALTDG